MTAKTATIIQATTSPLERIRNLGLIAAHDLLFLGEKGQAKSRLMRLLTRFLDEELPYLDIPGSPVHEDPYHPIT